MNPSYFPPLRLTNLVEPSPETDVDDTTLYSVSMDHGLESKQGSHTIAYDLSKHIKTDDLNAGFSEAIGRRNTQKHPLLELCFRLHLLQRLFHLASPNTPLFNLLHISRVRKENPTNTSVRETGDFCCKQRDFLLFLGWRARGRSCGFCKHRAAFFSA
ncbi:hypothetical protein V6N12_038754 [Hibiscus sabdariffa]|uniref:Uncharacterized protein n=1 Tax=Hibiscus sabdariffa TaxID=183260 RepID=A0ABR2CAR7_9ROSI